MRGPVLDREEYIEQEYFFRVYRERLLENVPSQEILKTISEEILATTRLPMAIDFMRDWNRRAMVTKLVERLLQTDANGQTVR